MGMYTVCSVDLHLQRLATYYIVMLSSSFRQQSLKYKRQRLTKTHQEMRQRTWTFFATTSHMYYKALRTFPRPQLHNTA